jgi:hypothetical protein
MKPAGVAWDRTFRQRVPGPQEADKLLHVKSSLTQLGNAAVEFLVHLLACVLGGAGYNFDLGCHSGPQWWEPVLRLPGAPRSIDPETGRNHRRR